MNDRSRAREVLALRSLLDETRLLMHRMKFVAGQIYRKGKMSGGRRRVMMSLHRLGPLTVPQLARSRPVSRQHMQMVVNALADDGYVELIDNPAHKRSHLVRLTRAGEALVTTMDLREIELLGKLRVTIPGWKLEGAAAVLRDVRDEFATERWARIAEQSRGTARSRTGRKRPRKARRGAREKGRRP
jgi:DNA-binding MarR family transcriptional regulator